MFISRFNRFFDRHSRIIYIGLGIIISLSFVVFVIPGSMSNLLGGRRRGGDIGRMYGEKISYDEFMQQLQLVDLANFLRTGEFMSQDTDKTAQLFQETLRRMRAMHEAEERGLSVVSDEEIAELIKTIFSREGTFDRDLFQGFKENVLYRRGLDGGHLDEALRQNIIMSRLDNDIYGAIYVSPNEARDMFNQFNEEFVVKYAVFRSNVMENGEPSEAEIERYFDEHREELRGPEKKRVRVAQFTEAAFEDDVTVTDAEVAAQYERLKGTDMKEKTLEEAEPEIRKMLVQQKARKLAGEAARAFATGLDEVLSDEMNAEERAAAFKEAAQEIGATVKDTGPFGETGVVPNIGKFPVFQRRAYSVTQEEPVSGLIYDAGRFFVVCWLETLPGDKPEELTEDVRNIISRKILEQEARELYAEKVEPYREPLQEVESAWELMDWYEQQLAEKADLGEEEKTELREEFREQIRTYIAPYFVQRQKKVRVAIFNPETFEPSVTVTDEAIQAYYEENQGEYQQEEVRARQIRVSVPPTASDEEKAEKRALLENALNELREGTSFEALVEKYSEDESTKPQGGDLGFFAKGEKPETIENSAFTMDVGQVSGILEIPGGLAVIKVEEKREGKGLADVRDEIRRKLVEKGAEEKAMAAAKTFGDKVFDEVVAAKVSGAKPGEVFERLATEKELQTKDTQFFSNRGVIPPFGYEPDLSSEAFKLTAETPLSDPIKGKTDVYVACWLASKPPQLPTLEDNPSLLNRLVGRVKRDRAIAVTRAQAAEAHAAIQEALAKGKTLESAVEALEDTTFITSEPFTRNQPPNTIPDARSLMEVLSETEPDSLLDPVENSNGATLVYLESRTLPSDGAFAEQQERFRNQVLWSKRYAIVQDFYNTLEKESNTVLFEPWRSEIEGAQTP